MENFLLSSLIFLIILTVLINVFAVAVNTIAHDHAEFVTGFQTFTDYQSVMQIRRFLTWSTGLVLALNLAVLL